MLSGVRGPVPWGDYAGSDEHDEGRISARRGFPTMTMIDEQPAIERPIYEIDFFHPCQPGETVHVAWKRVQREAPPIFWTNHNGGHWVATRTADIVTMQSDYTRFSNRNSRFPKADRPFPLYPLESDPPDHTGYRLLIAPAFSPRVMAHIDGKVRETAIEVINRLAPLGRCEFIGDFAKVLPIVVFLGMMELPAEDRHELLPHADAISRAQDQAVANAARVKVGEYLAKWVALRRENPGEDAISRIATAAPRGRALSEAETLGLCSLVLVGGLDTVASLIGFAAAHLAEHPEDRRLLREHPDLIPGAVEEMFRRFGVVNQTRVIVEDMVLHGAQLRRGDYIMLPNMLVGLDESTAPSPLSVDVTRKGAVHGGFGNGPHKCPGAPLARREMAVFLEEWLKRIPDFRITPGTRPVYVEGTVNSMVELQLSWTD